MREVHALVEGQVRLRLGVFGLTDAHNLVGERGYAALLAPLLGDTDENAIAVAVTPWVVALRVPRPFLPSPFEGLAGGTAALWWAGGLGKPAQDEDALVVQAVSWLAACRRLPASLGSHTGPVGAARIAFGFELSSWPSASMVRVS